MIAVEKQNAAMVEFLIMAGHSPDTAVRSYGEEPSTDPPLDRAIWNRDVETVKILLAHHANTAIRNTYSMTPLHAAAETGNAEVVKMLLSAGADVNAEQLAFSLPCGSGEEDTPQRNTPLHFAAASGNPETIKLLLDDGAKIEAVNAKGNTPLMATIESPIYTPVNYRSQLENAKLLIARERK